ncbi:FxLYD domain-containing protein [Niallia sp. FSL R7-0271]|uniref:FxLYD domain-containing protein n=1 Tax=Niallia sp. FSL R7-0271 TaxID=2921678 RepID=UPI0030FAD535
MIFIIVRMWNFVTDGSSVATVATNSPKTSKGLLVLEDTKCNSDGEYTYMTGFIKNIDDYSHSFIEVKGVLKDSQGNVLNTETIYAVGNEQLQPNERKDYEIMLQTVEGSSNCSYSISDFE